MAICEEDPVSKMIGVIFGSSPCMNIPMATPLVQTGFARMRVVIGRSLP
jgi:hypothetical protein